MSDVLLGSIGITCLAVVAVGIAGAPTAFLMKRPRTGVTLVVLAVVAFVGTLVVIGVAANPTRPAAASAENASP